MSVRRREFILGIAGAAALPMAARAQRQPDRRRRLAVLRYANKDDAGEQAALAVFRQELERLGWRDGDNIEIEILWARGDRKQLRENVAQLIARSPDALFVNAAAARAALDETHDRPIVFVNINDPVGLGLVQDLAHPGGNITGFYNYDFAMVGKWLETLKEIAPAVSRVGIVGSRDIPSYGGWVRAAEDFAKPLGVEILSPALGRDSEFDQALEQLGARGGGGLVVLPGNLVSRERDMIIEGAKRYRLPAIYPLNGYSRDGGLLSYGIDVADIYRRAATYVDRVLKGAHAGDLPVQGPSKFELLINLTTARELGLEVPQRLRLLADELIK